MKNIILLICFAGMIAFACSRPETTSTDHPTQTTIVQSADAGIQAAIIRAIDETTVPASAPAKGGIMDFVKNNIAELVIGLMGFLKIIVNLTPTEKDNKVFGLLDNFINFLIPNLKAGGGKHPG